jgi:hypothetical protein
VAASAQSGDIFDIGARIDVIAEGQDSVWVAGGQVSVLGNAKGDVWISGGDVEIDIATEGDLSSFGGGVRLRGRVAQDVAIAGASITVSADIGQNLRMAGATIRVLDSASIAGRTAIYGASAEFSGDARGGLYILADEVVFSGHASGDVTLQGRSVRIASGARIDGDVTVRMLGTPIVEPGAAIGGAIIAEPPLERAGRDRDWGLFTNLSIAFAASAFVIAVVAMFLSPAIVATASGALRHRAGLALANGLVAVIGGPVVAFALVAIFVTAPLGLFLFMAFPLLALLGHGLVGYVIGDVLIDATGLARRTLTRLAAVAIGVTLVSAIGLIPYIGIPLVLIILVFGIGAVLLAAAEHLFGFAQKSAT